MTPVAQVSITFTVDEAMAVEKAIRRTMDWLSFAQGEGTLYAQLESALWLFPKINGTPSMPKPRRRGLALETRP